MHLSLSDLGQFGTSWSDLDLQLKFNATVFLEDTISDYSKTYISLNGLCPFFNEYLSEICNKKTYTRKHIYVVERQLTSHII